MKRLCSLLALMLMTTAANAGALYSFEVGGQTININVSNGCDALDCVSVSGWASRHAGHRRSAARPVAKTASRHQAQPSMQIAERRPPTSPAVPEVEPAPLPKPAETSRSIEPPAQLSPPAPPSPAPVATAPVTLPDPAELSPPKPEPVLPSAPAPVVASTVVAATTPSVTAETTATITAAKAPAKAAAPDNPPPARAYYAPKLQEPDVPAPALAYYAAKAPAEAQPAKEASAGHEPSSLEGNWLAEDKSSVRIRPCGPYLCGYTLRPAANQTEEETLVDLKPISSSEWVGMILNHDTGITYPAIVAAEGENALRVRSCGMGVSFCGGQVWNRAAAVTAVR